MKKKSVQSSPAIPSRWTRHFRNLQSLRESLLKDRVSQFANIVVPMEAHGADLADSAADEVNHAMALGILSHENDALFEVDSAIGRIMDGSYGICEKTGRPIPESRLRVVPWTRFSKEALEQIERERMAGRLPWNSFAWLAPGLKSHGSIG
jgi:RNA polymerase-binding transcription factor DksA